MLQAESLRRCFRVTNQRLNSLVLIDTSLSVFSILDLLPRFTRILSYFRFYLR